MTFIPVELIEIGERIREGKGKDFEQFKESFYLFGQLQPIRVVQKNGKYELVAGYRRLCAISELHSEGKDIPNLPKGQIEIAHPDDPDIPVYVKLSKEFAENNDRADFDFVERAKFIRKFHEAMREKFGEKWTQEGTARILNLSTASISHYLRIEETVKTDAGVAKATTLRSAVKRMKVNEKIAQRITEAKREDNSSVERASAILSCADAREWIKNIPSGSVDLVNFDPPWGDNTSRKSAENHEEFEDGTEYASNLMEDLFPQIYRVLREDRFCTFWYRAWASERMASLAEKSGFNLKFTRTPCIWYKPDKTTDQNRYPEKQLIEAYEPFYILRKGDPVFHEKFTHNVFSFPRVTLGNIIHPTEKPIDLCLALVKLLSVPGETVVDPTSGSASFLDAGLRASRKVQGCELSPKYHERGIARLADYLKTFKDA